MHRARRTAAAMAVFLLSVSSILSEETLPRLDRILGASALAELEAKGKLVNAGEAGPTLALPIVHPAMDRLRLALGAEKPGIVVEAAFLLKRPAPKEPGREFSSIYSIMTSVSTLEGILYWSASRKTWRTFYAESYRIAAPDSKEKLADQAPTEDSAPLYLFAYQRDLSFGANVYRYDYEPVASASGRALMVTQVNLTRMSYGLIPVVGAGGLRTRLLAIPAQEGILFYAVSAADSPALPLLEGKLRESFSNRAEALYRWFSAKMGTGRQ